MKPEHVWPMRAVQVIGWIGRGLLVLLVALVILAAFVASITLGNPVWN